MLAFLTERCVNFLAHQGVLKKDEQEIYEYGLMIALSTFFCLLSIFIFSVLLGHLEYFFSFLIFFFSLRLFCGGYHAQTYRKCFIITNLLFFCNVGLTAIVSKLNLHWIVIIPIVCSFLIIFRFAPIINRNHPLTAYTYRKNKYISMVLSVCCLIILGLLYVFEYMSILFISSSLWYCFVSAMIIIEKIKEKGGD